MGDGEPIATTMGVQPEIDSLRAMLEPKVTGKSGARILASLGADTGLALPKENASVILFLWGVRVLPVFLTSVSIAELSYLPNLLPYVAKATVTVQVIESDNPFYNIESARQLVSAAVNTARVGTEIITKGF